jgi:AcrR family transcriptional regulator
VEIARVRVSRRRSLSSQQNDVKILEAALREVDAVGVDGLGMTAVARRAGLTTGALYGRYESSGEVAAALWTTVVSEHHFALLDCAVAALVDNGSSARFDELSNELSTPSIETMVALDLLATSRRVDELNEVVLPDLEQWMRHWGASPRTRQRRRRAQVVFTLGTIWGILLHIVPSQRKLDWRPVLSRVRWSFNQPYNEPPQRFVADRVDAVHAATGDPVLDELIDAVAAVIARVGLERATGSRIARRANLTSGAIYGRYTTKEDLLDQAIVTLLANRFTDDLMANSYTFTAADPGSATARIVGGYLSQTREQWRRFRIETQLAARHHPRIAATVNHVQEEALREYLEALGARTPEAQDALDILGRFVHLTPIGLAFVDLVLPGLQAIDWRAVLHPLLSPIPTT